MYVAENLKSLRKGKDWTQEEMAEMVGISPQSISKWERGDTFPDITLLPALANLFKVSVDAIIGMDKINEEEARIAIFKTGHEHLRQGNGEAAAKVFTDALKTYPSDESLMCELALVLSLESDPAKLQQAVSLCERVLSGNPTEKVRHTTRAAVCFIYFKMGEKDKALTVAGNLPHYRESREGVLRELKQEPPTENLNAYLRFLVLGEENTQYPLVVEFSHDMWIPLYVERKLPEKILEIRNELPNFPIVNMRDNSNLSSKVVRVHHYADCVLDKIFDDADEAMEEVILTLKKTGQK